MALAIAIGAMGSAVAVYSIQANADPSISVTLDGKELSLEDVNGKQVDPIYIDGTTYLPVRAISEALGMDVEWNTAKNQVELRKKQLLLRSQASLPAISWATRWGA